MQKKVLLTILVLGVAAQASAQPAISYTLRIYNQGSPAPLSTTTIPIASFTCNMVWPAVLTPVNPNKVYFDDPAFPVRPDPAARACLFVDALPTGPLLGLPFGTGIYEGRIVVNNSAGPSPDSVVSPPFTQPGTVGAAPTGLRLSR